MAPGKGAARPQTSAARPFAGFAHTLPNVLQHAEETPELFGLDFEVTSEVEYTLIEVATNKVMMREVVRTPFTAGVGDAFIAIKRLRLANEGSARTNIDAFLKRLSTLKIEAKQISLQH